MFYQASIPLCLIKSNDYSITFNKAYYKAFGSTDTNYISIHEWVDKVCYNHQTSDLDRYLNEILYSKSDYHLKPKECVIKKNDGEIRYALVYGSLVYNDFLLTILDITEQKLIENELFRTKDQLQEVNQISLSILKTIPYGMNIVDPDGVILYQNHNLSNYFKESVLGKICWEAYRDDKTQCKDCPLKLKIPLGETVYCITDKALGGKTFNISHTGIIYKGKEAVLEIFHDITEQRNYEKSLKNALRKAEESDKLKSAFLQNMSHEIRTPLNGIIGFSQLLKNDDLNQSEKEEFISMIDKSSKRLIELVNNMIEISLISTGQIEFNNKDICLNELLAELAYKFRNNHQSGKTKIINHLDEFSDWIFIKADEVKLTLALSNIIDNAFKFTKQGTIEIGSIDGIDKVSIYIKDSGIGIDKSHHEKIFENFYQVETSLSRNFEGAGLGLSISKGLIELLNGKIWVESELGKGSIFWICLPKIMDHRDVICQS